MPQGFYYQKYFGPDTYPPLAGRSPSPSSQLLFLQLSSLDVVVGVVLPAAVVQRVGRLVAPLPQQPRDPNLLRVPLVRPVVSPQHDLQMKSKSDDK